jgi:hypothetical protein
MKTQYQTQKLNTKPTPAVQPTEAGPVVQEQTASTSLASENAWLMVAGVLLVLIAGLYWFNDRQNDQPDWSYTVAPGDQLTTAEQTDSATGWLLSDNQEHPAALRPKGRAPSLPTPDISPNEALIRRYYDEVLNRRQMAVMDDLFATDFTYRPDMTSTEKSNLAAFKEEIRNERIGYPELSYSIEKITARGEWLIVRWAVRGWPRSLDHIPLTSSGSTAWQVVDGQIVHMLPFTATGSQPSRLYEP